LVEALRRRGLDRVKLIVGGIIPDADITKLEALGVAKVFTPGAPLPEIAEFIRASVKH
jgi:methylmalonyl-CoA mutase C-terminal domain/subunit